jgi:peptidoglycan/xylan/chitin deacetylase (PgdA/CDA1 family)
MSKKNILLTYDYELFLGSDSGDLYNTLINPINKILDMLEKYNAKALFFIDTTFLIAIKDTKCFEIVKEQIQDIVQKGFDIGLHLHPHWQNAESIDECRWKFEDFSHFRLDSFNDKDLRQVIIKNYELLSGIVNEVDANYKIDTFRAGGWSIQPFSRLKDIFKIIGIRYDFSVLPEMKDEDRPRHYYDFKNTPNKYIWRFEDNVLIEDKNGSFIEVSNTVFDMNIIDLMKNRKLIKNYKISGDGKGAGKQKAFLEQLKKVRWNVKQILSSDAIDLDIFKKYIDNINRDILVYVAHPKLFSDNSFEVLEYICDNLQIVRYSEL